MTRKETLELAKNIWHKIHHERQVVTMEGWVARDVDCFIAMYKLSPERMELKWLGGIMMSFPDHFFPEITWESEPVKVKITIEKL